MNQFSGVDAPETENANRAEQTRLQLAEPTAARDDPAPVRGESRAEYLCVLYVQAEGGHYLARFQIPDLDNALVPSGKEGFPAGPHRAAAPIPPSAHLLPPSL